MFTSQSLRAVRPTEQESGIREHRPDDVVRLLEVTGAISDANAYDICARIDTLLREGVRWCLIDLTDCPSVADPVLPWLVYAARELRARRGELIIAGSDPSVAQRLAAYEVAHRPALAATADQALMILKMLRPKTFKKRAPAAPAPTAPRLRITSLSLPRIEPQH